MFIKQIALANGYVVYMSVTYPTHIPVRPSSQPTEKNKHKSPIRLVPQCWMDFISASMHIPFHNVTQRLCSRGCASTPNSELSLTASLNDSKRVLHLLYTTIDSTIYDTTILIPSEARLYSGSIDLFRRHGPRPSQPLLRTYSLPNSQRTLTFVTELCTRDLEALTITAGLLQPVVFQAHYCA